ncbi:MAG: hypoxanthine phosphoribosyltransferase [Armatimonadota bacterium]
MTQLPCALLTREQISVRVRELAAQISHDYAGREPVLVGILRGAVVFLADLMREMTISATIDFMAISSYGDASTSSGEVRLLKDLDESIEGKDVLVVEDIVDSGRTLQFLLNTLEVRRPRSLKVCTLLDKPSRRVVDLSADYVGFQIPDLFVIGYGLDWAGRFRNLPYIAALTETNGGSQL